MGERVLFGVRAFVVVALALVVTLLALPSPMRSSAWAPPPAPALDGPLAPNDALEHVENLAPGELVGPEGVAIDELGRIYAGTADGKIVRVLPGMPLEVFTDTGGRPLGMAFAENGDLIVADVMKGLLRVDPTGKVEVLAKDVEGTPLVFLSSVAVSHDGHTVYATDASSKWAFGDAQNDVLEQVPSGRFIRFDLDTKEATVLVHGLAFADGIALAPDESYALVAETARYDIEKIWLTGDKKNIAETFATNLPGFPTAVTTSTHGTYWVGMYALRSRFLDAVNDFPFVKDCIAGLPGSLRPKLAPYGLVVEMDDDGHVVKSFHDPSGAHVAGVTSIVESRGVLYLGTLEGSSIGRFSP